VTARSWLVGRGLLGSAVAKRLGADRLWVPLHPVRWSDPQRRNEDLRHAARQFFDAVGEGSWQVAWCAGAGVVGTSADQLATEAEALREALDAIAAFQRSYGTVFLASSAGAVYAGSPNPPFNEASPCVPLSSYGHAKLRQEATATEWAGTTGNRLVIGRIANIYGPGQDLGKAQGLVTQICRSMVLRQPLMLYVPLDTVRDYVFVDDCAAMAIEMLDRAGATVPIGGTSVRIIATGRHTTIGSLLDVARRVSKRPLPLASVTSDLATMQSRDLRMAPLHPFPSTMVSTTLGSGVRSTFDDLVRQFQAGRLSSI
jgi:UDP-glucose 4-epimerase